MGQPAFLIGANCISCKCPRAAPGPVLPIARNFLQNLQAITGLISPFDSSNSDFLRDGKIFPNKLIFIDIFYFKG
jgi:hypothetical protein